MGVELFKHQIEVLNKVDGFKNVGLYLEMGLGKSYTSLEQAKRYGSKLNLIVCQKSKIQDWVDDCNTYDSEWFKPLIYSKGSKLPEEGTIIINYDSIWRRPELANLSDFTMILDESQYIKNPTSKRTKFILGLKPNHTLLLSGTPVGGKYEELVTQAQLLGWKITKKAFWDRYVNYITYDSSGFPIPIVTGYKNVDELKDKLRSHGAVFMKSEEAIELPESIEKEVMVPNTSKYRKFQKDEILYDGENPWLVGDTPTKKLLYSRQLASMYNDNKIQAFEDLLESAEDRLIVFYNFEYERELLVKSCKKFDKPISVVCGSEKDFTAYNEQYNSVFLVQYQAGASGLNLQKSNKIIYFSLPLSAELFEQSKARTRRIGQKRTCWYYYLLTEKSVDLKILEVLKKRMDYNIELFKE